MTTRLAPLISPIMRIEKSTAPTDHERTTGADVEAALDVGGDRGNGGHVVDVVPDTGWLRDRTLLPAGSLGRLEDRAEIAADQDCEPSDSLMSWPTLSRLRSRPIWMLVRVYRVMP